MKEFIGRENAVTVVGEAIADGMPWFDALMELPAADVIKRRSGRWIMKEVITKEFGRLMVCKCSRCKKNQTFQTKYCSNCGAEMELVV